MLTSYKLAFLEVIIKLIIKEKNKTCLNTKFLNNNRTNRSYSNNNKINSSQDLFLSFANNQ